MRHMEPCSLPKKSSESPSTMKSTKFAVSKDAQVKSQSTSDEVLQQNTSFSDDGNKKITDITLISRESPDGSSDSCEWPSPSPCSNSLFKTDDSSNLSHELPSISKLVHNKNIHIKASSTGTRPKESYIAQSLRDSVFSDTSDDVSGSRHSIPPSLLQVNYRGESTGNNYGSALSIHRTRGSQVCKTPQIRHRSVSGRLPLAGTDSDQDSEDTVEGTYPQVTRRRKRLSAPQPYSSLSVKSLIDSRGVLKFTNDCPVTSESKCERDIFQQFESRGKNTFDHWPDKVGDSGTSLLESCHNEGLPLRSSPVSTNLPSEVVSGVASSVPVSAMKQYSSTSKDTGKKNKTHGRSQSDGSQDIVKKVQLSHSSTAPDLEFKMNASKVDMDRIDSSKCIPVPERKRFMEDGGHSITPAADNGFFPRPQPGQSLIEFLSSKEFNKQQASLDRENAHFNISEAVIAALTQMQFNAWHQKVSSSPGAAEESDEEIRNLQARIREKRRQKLSNSIQKSPSYNEKIAPRTSEKTNCVYSSLPKLDSTTDCSVYESPPSSTYNSDSDLISEVEEETEETVSLEDAGTVLSERSTESEQLSLKSDLTSAENVAISLLKNFNEQRLPKASELEWLVSEKDVPQKLLPLPASIAVSPDDGSVLKDTHPQPQLRGTSDWAPPRPQLILTLITTTKRSSVMKTQGWRCAGCGMRVSEHLSRHFRLCNYLGRYFCTTCHSNQAAMIPARVLHKWDFRLYPVSNFSLELIESMKSDPLFNVSALNFSLFKKCRHLQQTHIYRLQLYHTLPYINTCSRAHSEKKLMASKPQHWAIDPHAYSLDDLVCVKNGTFVGEVKKITKLCINHIAKCQVCAGRGFICEICGKGEPIFPFQLDSTAICNTCSACYHIGCFCPFRCPRCIRRETRHLLEGDL